MSKAEERALQKYPLMSNDDKEASTYASTIDKA